jgi:hypothetical protein
LIRFTIDLCFGDNHQVKDRVIEGKGCREKEGRKKKEEKGRRKNFYEIILEENKSKKTDIFIPSVLMHFQIDDDRRNWRY